MTSSPLDRRRFGLAAATSLFAMGAAGRGRAAQGPAGAGSAPAQEAAWVDPVAAACAREDRMPRDLERDGTRHPQRILDFFQIKPGQVVADLQAGDGYYTELLSRIVGKEGRVYCTNNSAPQRVYGPRLTERLERKEFDTRNVVRVDRELDDLQIQGQVDRVLLIRFYHDFVWMEVDRAAFNEMVFQLLKPGGVFGVIDHRSKDGAGVSEGRSLHRVEEKLVREEITAAGFVLEAESHLLSDPTDTRDWNIFEDRGAKNDRTDRFVHFYRKPTGA